MDEETKAFQDGLWRRYLGASDALATAKKVLEEYGKKVDDASRRANLYARMLQEEGLDPTNPPASFKGRPPEPEPTPQAEERPTEERAVVSPEPFVLHPANGQNGNGAPINKTHAVFLVMRKAENAPLSLDELFTKSEEAGYGVSKEDIGRVVARQIGRGFMTKEDGKYKQTAEGEKFTNFIRREASAQAQG